MIALPVTGFLLLQNSRVQTFLIRKLTEQLSLRTGAHLSIGKVHYIFFNRLTLNDVLLADSRNDTIFYTGRVSMKIDTLKIRKKRVAIEELIFSDNKIVVSRDSSGEYNFSFLTGSMQSGKDTVPGSWSLGCNKFRFKNSELRYSDSYSPGKTAFFVRQLNLGIRNFVNKNDSLAFDITELSFNDGKKIELEKSSGHFCSTPGKVELTSFNLVTQKSKINNLSLLLQFPAGAGTRLKNLNADLQVSKSLVDFSELAELVPALRGMDEKIEFSGHIYGNIEDLKGKELTLKTGRNTLAVFDFYLNGLEDLESMYMFLDLKKLETTFGDIESFSFPENSKIRQLQIPETMMEAGLLRYNGNFSGFISDFVTFGTLQSNMGIIKTDLSLIPLENKAFQYKGRIQTTNFKLGKFLNQKNIGELTFNGEVNGSYNIGDKAIAGFFSGDIDKIEANRYVYRNIGLNGVYMDKMYDGMLSINDSNLQFTFLGRVDLGSQTPEFDFNLHLEKARLANLNFSRNFPKAEVAMNVKAKFTGSNLDNLKGAIIVEDGYYKNRFGDFDLKGLQLLSVPNGNKSELAFSSPYFDIEVKGQYEFQSIADALENNIRHFLPSFGFDIPPSIESNIFDFKINVKNIDELASVFTPGLSFNKPFFLYGSMNSNLYTLELEGSIPEINYKGWQVRDVFIGNKIIDKNYTSKFNFGEIGFNDRFRVFDVNIRSEAANNVLSNNIEWKSDMAKTDISTIQSRSYFTPIPSSVFPSVRVEFLPSKIYLGGEPWNYKGFYAKIDSSHVKIETFVMSNEKQQVTIKGSVSKDSTEVLTLNLEDINLSDLNGEKKGKKLDGTLSCSVAVSNLYRTPVVVADVKIDTLKIDELTVGDVYLASWWDDVEKIIHSELEIADHHKKSLSASGYYRPETREINYIAVADSLPAKLLETVIAGGLSDFSGFASGSVIIHGSLDKIKMDGAVRAENAGIKVDYTQVKYFLDDSIRFKTDTIWFKNITIADRENNTGKFDGILVHDNFNNMLYDLRVSSRKIMALNTTSSDNELFYGDAYANANISITGRGSVVRLEGTATSLPGTSVNISMMYESEMQQYDFLEFISNEESENETYTFKPKPSFDFSMKLTTEVTPDAKVQLIYNSQIGDVIKAQGEGILLFEMNKDGDISLSGDYTVTKGDYLFTLQNVVNKRFTIAPGGKIIWSGNPYNAIIDISAIYRLKTSVKELLSYPGSDKLSQRVPVECIIKLTDELVNPTIAFEIDFPDDKEGIKDELLQFFNTEEEKNRQILSLIVLGQFYTPEYLRGRYETQNPNMIGTTASELFSNQLSNWLSKISNSFDVGLNYRPGNSITADELELALSTQIFNDRVTIDGNIGNNVSPESNSSSQIVGDVDIRVKLVPNGKIQFKAFNHANNNLIYETAPYTQGIGLSFKEEYNSVRDLLQKIKSLFVKKAG